MAPKEPSIHDQRVGLTVCQPRCEALYNSGIYEPLVTNERVLSAIRLLVLLPGIDAEPIKCEMIQNVPLVSLNSQDEQTPFAQHEQPDLPSELDGREFFALSYCRTTTSDASSDTDVINIQGVDFDVSRNLVDAMLQARGHLSRTGSAPIVWVDQLCINQSDAAESAQQVTLMKEIYGQAKSTIACLGPDEDGYAANAAGYLWFFHSRHIELADHENGLSFALNESRERLNQDYSWTFEDTDKDDHKSLRWLCAHKWFKDAWNLQPLLLAREINFICERNEFSAEVLFRALVLLTWLDTGSGNEFRMPISRDFFNLQRFAVARWTPDLVSYMNTGLAPKTPFSPILWQLALPLVASTNVADPRDRVYSIVNLTDKSQHSLEPAYSAADTPRRAFSQATAALIEQSGTLDIVLSALANPSGPFDLPSWVPNFNHPLGRHDFARSWNPSTESTSTEGPPLIPLPTFAAETDTPHDMAVLECTVMVMDDSITPAGMKFSVSAELLENDRIVLIARCGTPVALRHVTGRTYRLLCPAQTEGLDVDAFQSRMLGFPDCPWVFRVRIV